MELERERHARGLAVADAERQREFARMLDRLSSALFGSATLDGFLHKLLGIFLDVARAEAGVVRVREGQRLRARAAIGLEEEVSSGFATSVAESCAELGEEGDLDAHGSDLPIEADADAPCRSGFMRAADLRKLYVMPLAEGDELFGAVYLGASDDHTLSADQRELLTAIASRGATAALHMAVHESLQQAVRARDDILGLVAHDLRNPMNIISITAHSLMQRLTDSSARRSVERIVRGVQRADRLIRDLLEISAIEDGRFSVEPRTVETADLILAALESQQSLAATASVIISTDLTPDLPPIEADEERILEVFENLISNAVKFTSEGGTVTVGAEVRTDDVLFWVKDNGAGISPEQLPRLFDRFWQARRTDRRGFGLGLTICKAIVEAHNGKIWVDSTLGAGATFYFTLPCDGSRRSTGSRARDKANVLLVDDRPENLLALETILERPDYRLVRATSGEEALSLALRERFAVALIDVAMPGMNGLEVAVHLKELERSRDIPIIFITAFGDDPEEIHRAYSAGGADYLVKPLDAEIVRKKVAVFVDLSRRRLITERLPDETRKP